MVGQSREDEVQTRRLIPRLINLLRDPTAVLSSTVGGALELDEDEKRRQVLLARIKNATTYTEWHGVAIELDRIEGNEDWKITLDSPDYDYALIESKLIQLDRARASCDVKRILFLIRTSLSRNLGDMGNIKLYRHSHTGTKHLIEAYISSVISTITTLLSLTSPDSSAYSGLNQRPLSNYGILESLLATRQSFGRTALLFSGGATFGMYHIGVLKALFEANLLPRIISGASAGSIVSAVLCTRTDEEIPIVLRDFPYGKMDVFEDPGQPDTILGRIARLMKIGAWIDIKHLTRVMQDMLGDITFVEAYNRTRRILNICVSSTSVYELPKLLNYITAPNVIIWSAVAASCSVPFIFSSAPILAKDPKTGLPVQWNPSPQRWIDGSVDNDLPITRLSELFNVNHFIVSQVNPHIAPFLPREELLSQSELTSSLPWSLLSHSTTETEGATGPGWGERLTKLALGEIMHRMNILAEIGIMRTPLTKARSVLAQKYSGDITLLPEVNLSEFPRLLKNPTTEFMKDAILRGERATWPKLSRIANHCAVEIALDKAILQLRAKVLFDSGDIDARVGSWAGLGVEGANIGGVAKGSGDWSTQRRNGAERRLRMQSSGPIELSTMAKLRSNGVIFRMPVDPDSKNGRAMRDLQMNRKGPSSPTLSRGPMSKSMLNLPHDGTTNNGPFASSTSGSSSVHKGITPPRHPNQHRRTGPPVCSDDPIKVSYRDVGASGSTLYPDDESSTEGEQQEFEGGKGQSRSGYQSPGKRRRLSFSSSKPDTTSSTQNTSVYQNGDALRGSRSTPSLAYDDMFPHRHLSSQSPQAKRGGSRDYYNNNTNDTQGYFSYSPATPQPHHWSQYSGFGLTMTPSISNSPEVNYSRSVAASGMISPGGSARVYATPLLSTTPPHSETAMVDLDVSGTRGMLRRRRSVGQLQLLNSFAASTLALLQPVVTPASQTSTTEMNDSGVGGGLGVKVGLGRAKSAEQLRGR